MNKQEVLKYIDEIVFAQTGKHLDTLQFAILKGVFNGQKYSEVAQEYNCTEGHARDEAYELWQILSQALGESLNKSNIRAKFERIISTNSNIIGNPVQIGNINLCPNTLEADEIKIDDIENFPDKNYINKLSDIEEVKREFKLQTISRLQAIGLTAEQISQALDLPLQFILESLK